MCRPRLLQDCNSVLGMSTDNEVLSFHAYRYRKCVNDLHIHANGTSSLSCMGKKNRYKFIIVLKTQMFSLKDHH